MDLHLNDKVVLVTGGAHGPGAAAPGCRRWGGGRAPAGRIHRASDDGWTAGLNLKVLAAVRATRLTVPHLIAAGGGAIVNVLNIGDKAARHRALAAAPPAA